METFDIYQDIMTRTGGDIYIGVVGPVRTGKSTFIKKFMENLVIPNIEDENRRERVIDELPQSADGKTIMTTEPKFVPDSGVRVNFGEGLEANIRLIDSVGYIVADAEGYREGDTDRYVMTPWSEEKMTFKDAGEFGTKKVIEDHSTVGIVVVTDGSIAGLPRESYLESEEKVIADMLRLGKPFVIVLNTRYPDAHETAVLRDNLAAKYHVGVIVKSVIDMTRKDADDILRELLMEFPLRGIEIDVPSYMAGLDVDSDIVSNIKSRVMDATANMSKMSDYLALEDIARDSDYIDKVTTASIDFGKGIITYDVKAREGLFYDVISLESGVDIHNDMDLVSYIKGLRGAEKVLEQMGGAIDEAERLGYGIVEPSVSDIEVGEPTIYKKGGKCQVKISAKAPSMHIMKVDVGVDICPIMGTEEQCNEMIEYIKSEASGGNIMDVSIFNKSLYTMITDAMSAKANVVNSDTRAKMVKTMNRIVNEGKGGVLCVLI